MCAGRPRTYQYYCHHWYGVLHTQLEVFSKNVDCNFFSDYLCQMKQQSIVRYRNPLLFQRLSPFFLFFYFQLWNLNCQSTFSRLSGSTRRNQIHFWYPNNSLYLLLLASQSCNIPWVNGEIRISIWNWVVHYSGVKTISTLNKN